MTHLLLLMALAAGAPAAGASPGPDRPEYPEGADVPRGLTDEEAGYLALHPLAPRSDATPPSGAIRCPAEYEPMAGILIAWEGPASFTAILTRIGAEATTAGNADLYVAVDTTTEETNALAQLAAGGADLGRVHTLVGPTDTIWMRDYGPRYIYEGGCRAIVDHTYNRPRPNDDAFPQAFAARLRHARYDLPLVHGGGNFHLDAVRRSYATRLVDNENPGLSEPEIHDLWQAYQGVDTTFFDPYPTAIDSTQHLDMWMQVIGDDAVMISDWPVDPGSTQDRICDAAAQTMAAKGITVHRVPARSANGTHYTYTNVVMVNDVVLIPAYSDPQVALYNPDALAAWQAALPGKTIVPIDAQAIVTSSGVLHCIVMHLPAPLAGPRPSAYLKSPAGCAQLAPGSAVQVGWISDDDRATVAADLLLSTDGGRTFPIPIATGVPDTGSYLWTVPTLGTATARLRVVVHDADGSSGSDDSDGDFAIGAGGAPPPPPGPLHAVKTTGTPGSITLVVAGAATAAAYNLYEGPLGSFYSPDVSRCHRDATDPALVITGLGEVEYRLSPAAGSRWFLESASACAGESTLGLPPAAWMCGPTR